jgi:predicted TPR repeat methyltransferase
MYCMILSLTLQVLEISEELDYAPEWVCKARFRRGQAQARKRNFDAALQDFSLVLKLQPQV